MSREAKRELIILNLCLEYYLIKSFIRLYISELRSDDFQLEKYSR